MSEIEAVDLSDGRRLVVRHAGEQDIADVQALYGRLSSNDLDLRFFQPHTPQERITAAWLTLGERNGVALVIEVAEHDGSKLLIAEAGYCLLDDGDGELAITVDPEWRGWLGPWLLDILVEQAQINQVPNLQADVQIRNRQMRALLEHRGYAAVDHPDWHEIRLVISTSGHTPGWPPNTERPHLLAVAPGARWAGEAQAQEAGFEVRTCAGPGAAGTNCPLLAGESCPLLDGADAVVFDMAPEIPANSDVAEGVQQKTVPVAYTRAAGAGFRGAPCERSAAALAQIMEALDAAQGDDS